MSRPAFALVAALTATPAVAQMSMYEMAQFLATAIAGESVCGYTLSESAVEDFVIARLPPDDTQFPGLLSGLLTLQGSTAPNLTGAAKVAHCTALRLTVERQGLIPPAN